MEWRKLILMLLIAVLIIAVFTVILENRKNDKKIEIVSAGNGKELFLQNCAVCHGRDGEGTVQAKGLRRRQLDTAYVKRIIQTGNTVMPRFHFIHDPALSEIADYVHKMK